MVRYFNLFFFENLWLSCIFIQTTRSYRSICRQHEWVVLSFVYNVPCVSVERWFHMYSDLSLALHSLTDKYCAHMFYLTFWGIRCFCSNCSVDLATKANVMPVLPRNWSLWQGNGAVWGSKTLYHFSPWISGRLPQQACFRSCSAGKSYKTLFLQGQRTEEE